MLYHHTIRAMAAGAFALAGVAAAQAECTPSKWGADDEIGSANHVTPERTLAAMALVKEGKSAPLGIVIDSKTPAFAPRGLSLTIVTPGQTGGTRLSQFGYPGVYTDDMATLWFGIGSQIDGLGHLGENGVYYNCIDETDFVELTGLTRLGVHNIPPLIARAVIVDMAAHAGKDFLDAGEWFGEAEIKAAMEAQEITVNPGDIVLFHTGWTDAKLTTEPSVWVSGEPGITTDGARYMASLDVMAVGADTWGLDAVPPKDGDGVFYAHVVLLRDHGIYILETMNTGQLVEQGVKEFAFVLGQARIRGTVQMIINPVALW